MQKTMVLGVVLSLFTAVQADAPFGYSDQSVVAATDAAQKTIRLQHYKRYAVYCAAASVILGSLYCWKTAEQSGELTEKDFKVEIDKVQFDVTVDPGDKLTGTHGVQFGPVAGTAESVMRIIRREAPRGWLASGWYWTKRVGTFMVESALGSAIFMALDTDRLNSYAPKPTTLWFATSSLSDTFELLPEISELVSLLPTIEKQEETDYRISLIRNNTKRVVTGLVRLLGYMRYVYQYVEDPQTAADMRETLIHLQNSVESFCCNFDEKLTDYQTNATTDEERLEKSMKLETVLTEFRDNLNTDLKAFILYEGK